MVDATAEVKLVCDECGFEEAGNPEEGEAPSTVAIRHYVDTGHRVSVSATVAAPTDP